MRRLFSGEGADKRFLAIRDSDHLSDIRPECERLWNYYRTLAPDDFIDQFSQDFRGRFWEMYLGVLLRAHHPELEVPETGPDFSIPGGDHRVFIEATSASRGNTEDALPDISKRSDDDDTVPFRECVLRITASLKTKSEAHQAMCHAKEAAYVVAVNLPFPEAWLCGPDPLSASAVLGFGGMRFKAFRLPGGGYDYRDPSVSYNPSIRKQETEAVVPATGFLCSQYKHVSALLVASVNPFSSTYDHPGIEYLHNPNATHPLPLEWLPVGCEYWVADDKLKSRNHGAPRQPWTMNSRRVQRRSWA